MRKLVRLLVCAVVALNAIQSANADSEDPTHADIKPDEFVVFFRTSAWLDKDKQAWRIPIHGWIYEPEDSKSRLALFESILDSKYDLVPDSDTEQNFLHRLNLLIADNERGKSIVINIAGQTFTLPPSAPNGHVQTTLSIAVEDVAPYTRHSALGFSAVVHEDEQRHFAGEVLLVDPGGLSIISDIDDTVKISEVTHRKALLENTFLLDFAAAPGMAKLFNHWSDDETSFHFVSSSPWQLYAPLVDFLDEAGFPRASLNLKAVRFRDETLFDLFKEGTETKPQVIEGILHTYPERRFILVGDSGEQDPEVYAAVARKYPEQIEMIYLRNVTGESADNERFRILFENINEELWMLFEHPASIQHTAPEHAQK